MKIRAIDHIVLRTDKLEQMLAFYQQLLGCTLERRLDDLGLEQLRAGNAIIDLVSVDKPLGNAGGDGVTQHNANMAHFCLQVSGVTEAQLLAHIEDYCRRFAINKKTILAEDSFDHRYGATGFGQSLYIKDPQDNIVELKLV